MGAKSHYLSIESKSIHYLTVKGKAIFRQFKQKFYLKESKNFQSLYQLVYKFVKQYNEIIPHSSLWGGTPLEIFQNRFQIEKYKKESKAFLFKSRENRRAEFHKCYKCSIKFLRQLSNYF
jgi:hypothetical protein